MSDRGARYQPAAYPERRQRRQSPVERLLLGLAYYAQLLAPKPSVRSIAKQVGNVRAADAALELQALRYDLRKSGRRHDLVRRALALAARTAAAHSMEADDRQLAAAWLLVTGNAVELPAPEHRPLACALAAAAAAIGGTPVHIIVATGHVARRDAAAMQPLFGALGLKAGFVDESLNAEQRKLAYACDVVYCVQREVALDYLRDRLALKGKPREVRLRTELLTTHAPRSRQLMLKGLQFAIVDEADVVMFDAVQTPVVISADAESSQEVRWLAEALELAGRLGEADYTVHEAKFVELTPAGSRRLEQLAQAMSGIWQGAQRREEVVKLALVAGFLMQRETHYLVNGKNLQADPHALRDFARQEASAMRLLRLLLEIKEGCTPTATREMLARIAYQRFFRAYLGYGAVAADLAGLGSEMWRAYRLPVAAMRSPSRLWVGLADVFLPDRKACLAAVAARAAELRARAIPVLIVTRNQGACMQWSAGLREAGLEHECLMGAQDEKEAGAFAQAAVPGRVTLIPHFAARGCSVARNAATEKLGGLRVIFVQALPGARHLRSLMARSVPEGTPGSMQRMLGLDDEVITAYLPEWCAARAPAPVRGLLLRYCQWRFERDNVVGRGELLRAEDYLGDLLAFSGGSD